MLRDTLTRGFRRALWLAVCLTSTGALAAGGHHGVDDASLLDPGQCELEGWATRMQGGDRLVHAGGGCRVGPVELAAASEYTRQPGASQTGWEAQLKWALPLTESFSAGISITPFWQAHVQPRYPGTIVSALFTWKASESLSAHVNVGRDLLHGAPSQARSGVALEWSPRPRLSVLGERYVEDQTQFLRAGLRWSLGEELTVDASRAQRLSGPGSSNWTVGISRQFNVR